MKKYLLAFVLFLFATDCLAREMWRNFGYPLPIRDAVAFNDGIALATAGGVRYKTPSFDYVFTSAEGLETSDYYSVVLVGSGLFALSEYGKVAYFRTAENRWQILNRAYEINKSRVLPGISVAIQGFIVIAFEDRLAFFDIDKASSVITLERIKSSILSVDKIARVAIHEDSIYVRLKSGIYVREMNWGNIYKDVQLSNPDSWVKLEDDVVIKGLEDMDFSWNIVTDNGTYEVDSTSIYYTKNDKVQNFTFLEGFGLNNVYQVRNLPHGGVVAVTENGYLSNNYDGFSWNNRGAVGNGSNMGYALNFHMKDASVTPDGHVFYHTWCNAYTILDEWGLEDEYEFRAGEGHCFDEFEKGCPVSIASTPAPDGSGFLTASGHRDGYSLVYFTNKGEVHCASHVGSALLGGPMQATVDSSGSWVVYVGTNKSSGNVNYGDLDIIRFPSPRTKGNELVDVKVKTVTGIDPSPLDMAYDPKDKCLWMVSVSSLAYYDSELDTIVSPKSTNGLQGAEYSALEIDSHGNLWVGTSNQGAYRLTRKNKTHDTLSVMRFTAKNGMLDDEVLDIAIDPIYGEAWFAHKNGLSSYYRNDLKDASTNMTDSNKTKVAAYPVPFRPKVHKYFVIENISEKATVGIYNRGGALIRTFKDHEILGGRMEWDGLDKANRLVAPGVYYYVVNAPSKTVKGKFIVVH